MSRLMPVPANPVDRTNPDDEHRTARGAPVEA